MLHDRTDEKSVCVCPLFLEKTQVPAGKFPSFHLFRTSFYVCLSLEDRSRTPKLKLQLKLSAYALKSVVVVVVTQIYLG